MAITLAMRVIPDLAIDAMKIFQTEILCSNNQSFFAW
jgi:hypothetical protein